MVISYYWSVQQTRAKPGAALQTSLSLIHWLSHPLVKISLRRRHAQKVKNGASSQKRNYFRDSKSWRAFKLLYRVKSYADFAECVDFAYWWSCIRKGLPCSLRSRLVYWYTFGCCYLHNLGYFVFGAFTKSIPLPWMYNLLHKPF